MGLPLSLLLLLLSTPTVYPFVFSCQEIKDVLINSDLTEPTEYACLVPEEGYVNVESLKTIYAQIDKISFELSEILSTEGLCVSRVTGEGAWRIVADPPITLDCNQQLALIFTSSLPDFIRVEKQKRDYTIDHERVVVSPRAGMKIHSTSCTGEGNITIFTGSGTGVSEYRYLLESWRCGEVPDWIISFENVITITVDSGVKYSCEISSDFQSDTAVHPRERISVLTSGKSDNLQNAHPNENYAKFRIDDVVTATAKGQLSFDEKYDGTIEIRFSNRDGDWSEKFTKNGPLTDIFNASYFEVHYLTSNPETVWDNQDNFIIDFSLGDIIPAPTTPAPKPVPVGPGEVSSTGYCSCQMDYDNYDTDGTWKLEEIWIDLIFIIDVSEAMGGSVKDAAGLIEQIVEFLGTDPKAAFYTRVGVITMADKINIEFDLNMTDDDDLDVQVADGVTKIDVTNAFKTALDMFNRGAVTNRADRQHARQVIYYISNSDPDEIFNGIEQFKVSGGKIIVSDYTTEGQGERPKLKDIATPGYYFNDLKDDYLHTYPLLCEMNCFCHKEDAYKVPDDSRVDAQGGCFHTNQAGVTWSKAQKDCSKTQNGKIAAPHDQSKEFFLNSLVSALTKPKQPFWIGYSSDGDKWTFEDNSVNVWTDFDPSDNLNNGAQCAYQVQTNGFNSTWHAGNCKAGYPSVCEMAPCSVGYSNCNVE